MLTGSRGRPEARVFSRVGFSTSSQKLWWARIRLGTFPNRVSTDTWRREQNQATCLGRSLIGSIGLGQARTAKLGWWSGSGGLLGVWSEKVSREGRWCPRIWSSRKSDWAAWRAL